MINKLLVFLLALIISTNANSCSPWDPRCSMPVLDNKFYGGVTFGYANLVGQLNRTLNVQTSDRVTSLGEGTNVPGVFFGYQKIIEGRVYIASEAFYQYSNILIEKEENTFPAFVNYFTYIKNDNKYGIAGKVGFTHQNNIFYIKLGLAVSRFTLGFKDNSNNDGITSSVTRREKGMLFGLGTDYFISKSVGVGVEYEITKYPSMKFKNNIVGSFSFKPVTHTFQMRFKYTF